jgi:hypothetical protein
MLRDQVVVTQLLGTLLQKIRHLDLRPASLHLSTANAQEGTTGERSQYTTRA